MQEEYEQTRATLPPGGLALLGTPHRHDHAKKHAHRNGLAEQHDLLPPDAPHALVLDLTDPVTVVCAFAALVHDEHVRDGVGVAPVVAFHAVHIDAPDTSTVMPASTMVAESGPTTNCAHVDAT